MWTWRNFFPTLGALCGIFANFIYGKQIPKWQTKGIGKVLEFLDQIFVACVICVMGS